MKKSVKIFCLLLSLVLLIDPCCQNTALAIQDLDDEYYIASYDCQKGTTTIKSLTQTIKNAKDSGKNFI